MNKIIKLYHYSDKALKVIKPAFFGANSYTANDKETCNINRSFFYTDITQAEYNVKSLKCLYQCELSANKIYNLDKDILNLKDKNNYNIHAILTDIIKYGYKACSYNVGFNIVCSFINLRIIKVYEI